jgi:hypothetical protein
MIRKAPSSVARVESQTGQPRRRSQPNTGCTVTVSIRARNVGPSIAANAFIPPTATTAPAPPSRMIRPRGSDHRSLVPSVRVVMATPSRSPRAAVQSSAGWSTVVQPIARSGGTRTVCRT